MSSPRITPVTARSILFSSTGRHGTRAETEPVIDHGKSAAGQLRRPHKLSAHGLALFNRREGKPPFGGKLAADRIHFVPLKGRDEIGSVPQFGRSRTLGVGV